MTETHGGAWSEREELILRAAARVRQGLHRNPFSGLLVFLPDRYAEAIAATLDEFVPAGIPLSLVLADLDRFTAINLTHGHAVGDQVLAAAAATLRDLVRPLDMVLSSGSDAYIVVLLGAGSDVAQARAEEARARLARVIAPGGSTGVTASFGVATHDGSESAMELFERGLDAERRAKALGRDRVEVSLAP